MESESESETKTKLLNRELASGSVSISVDRY